MKKAFIEAIPFIALIGCLFIVATTIHLWPGKTSPLPKPRISTVNGTDFIPQNSGYTITAAKGGVEKTTWMSKGPMGYIKSSASGERYEDFINEGDRK